MFTAEVISIGDELTSGQRLDTNSQWLSTRLGELGVRVMYHTTVSDDIEANVQVFQQAFERVDVVVATGGLGPTADDLTRDALAAATGRELQLDEDSLRHIRELFASRRREMPERNVVQAMFPRGSTAIFNPHGSAPGIAMEIQHGDLPGQASDLDGVCRFFALPGVPVEMREMWPAVCERLEQAGLVGQVIRHRRIKCFGIGESDLEQMLPDLIRRGRQPSVGITVSGATITLRITAAAPTPEACFTAMGPTEAAIRQCLGTLVFGEEDDELQHAVARLLVRRNQTLAVVEWGTGGQIVHWLRETLMMESLLLGGVVVSHSQIAAKLLGLPPKTFLTCSPQSAEAAEHLAAAGRQQFGADYVLAVSQFPSADKPSGDDHIFIALATEGGVTHQSRRFAGHPDILAVQAAKQCLDLLRLALLE